MSGTPVLRYSFSDSIHDKGPPDWGCKRNLQEHLGCHPKTQNSAGCWSSDLRDLCPHVEIGWSNRGDPSILEVLNILSFRVSESWFKLKKKPSFEFFVKLFRRMFSKEPTWILSGEKMSAFFRSDPIKVPPTWENARLCPSKLGCAPKKKFWAGGLIGLKAV